MYTEDTLKRLKRSQKKKTNEIQSIPQGKCT